MANISSVGIGSGVLTSDLIDKLVAAEKEPTEKRLDAKEEEITAELSIFGQIQSAVTDFRLSSRPLADPNLFNELEVTSGSSAFTASASSSAQPGSFTLEVSNLAKSHSLSTAEFTDADSTAVGTGSLDIIIAGVTTSITIDGSNNTLNGIATAINDEAGLAASASVVNTGTGYKLVITSDETGSANEIEIQVTDTGDGLPLDNFGLSRLSYTTGGQNLTENQAATDASFQFNGLAITRGSNTFDDLIEGVEITLSGTNSGSPAILELKRDEDSIVEKVQDFVDKFNALQKLIADNTEFNPDNPAASGLLMGDTSTRTIINQIQNVLGQTVQGLGGANVRSVSELGITTDKFSGQLSFDSEVFKTKLSESGTDVTGIFADQGRTTDSQVEFVRAGSKTAVGTYDVNVNQVATQGSYTGSFALTGSTIIDGTNNTFSISVDGTNSSTITLDNNTYTNEQLVTEIQSKINADTTLSGASKAVTVSLDGSNQLVFTSSTYGSDSKVEITSSAASSPATLGLDVDIGRDGLDVAGTINGVTAIGSGKTLTSGEGADSRGYVAGSVSLTGSTAVTAGNYEFVISVDGTTSGTISLKAGTYTNAELVSEIQSRINADSALSAAGKSVSVSVDADDKIVISSKSDGSGSKVSLSSVDTDIVTNLGLSSGNGTDGVTATSSTGTNGSEGIRININGGSTGSRGTVSYIEGVAEQMVDLVNSFLSENGTITAKNERLNSVLTEIAKDRLSLNERVETLNERLVAQFTAADIAIARLNSTQEFLKTQLAALTGNSNKDD